MNYNDAIKILNLDMKFTEKDLKRSYYKQALKYHPDKTQGKECEFKKVVNAYEFLSKYKNIESSIEIENKDYLSMIKNFIRCIFPTLEVSDEILEDNLKNIFSKFKQLSLKVFKDMPRDELIKLYTFINKNQEIFNLNNSLLERILDIIKDKIDIDDIIILNPDINDLLSDNVYCLNIEDNELLIPLWHDEVEFDISKSIICVKNIPDLENNVVIDKYNNINVNIEYKITDLLKNDLVFQLGDKKYTIQSKKLNIIRQQIYIIKNSGMLQINKDNLFDTEKRGDINVNVILNV
jgi:hypothetical protein